MTVLDIKVDDFLDFTEKMQNLEDILQSYIPSDEDLDTMRREPDKYMLFMNYYLNVERKRDVANELSEEERERQKFVKKQINEIVRKNLIIK